MQCGPKGMHNFSTICLNKIDNKNEPVKVFQFCFQNFMGRSVIAHVFWFL